MDKQAALSEERKRLLAMRLKGSAAPQPKAPRARSQNPALSAAQHQMWIIEQMNPGTAAYHIPVAYRIAGALDVRALQGSFNEIIRRHESWRTTFRELGGSPVQEIHAECEIQIRVTDLCHLPADEREREARALAAEEAVRPFELRQLPLVRVSLFRLAESDHVLLLNVHHIVADGISLRLMFGELDTLYRAAVSGEPARLPALAAQYADFAAWQEEELSSGRHSKQSDYWRQQLKGELPVLEIGTDKPRPLRQSFNGSTASFEIPKPLAQALTAIGNQERCTFFVTMLAAFQILLTRCSRTKDIIIGTPVASRPLPEFEPLIGNFLNIVALRSDLSGDPAFTELLRRCRETTLLALANADVPFETVVQSLNTRRDPGRNPVFQVLMQVLPPVHARIGGLHVSRFDFDARFSQVDLTLHLFEEADGGFFGQVQFCTDLFSADAIGRLTKNFTHLLEDIVRNPAAPLSRLSILGEVERQRILTEWSGSERPYPQHQTIAARFEECAGKTPAAVAVIEGGERLTYAQLDARANRVARFLQSRGVRAGDFVGLRAERSLAFVVKVLGIAKAGGAYVPLDESEPAARLAAMKAACALILDAEPDGDAPAEPVVSTAQPDGPAYVLYTSGSTGVPKGVIVPHRGITRLVVNNDYAPFQPEDVVAFASNVCFDAATFEIWGALLNGAALIITPRDVLLSPAALAAHLAEHRVTVLFLTTSLFNQLAHDSPAMFARLRILVFGGEAADAASVRLVLAHGKPQRLVNGYGPTETTTFAICHPITKLDGPAVPIGRPIANTRVFLLDGAMQPVPVGVAGEICIGGPGVALGYHGAPELTAEKFTGTPYGRLYRTGDLARWLADGTIEYLGRIDQQVKLRGFRIEPGEIEAALRQHPQIRHAAVVARTEAGAAHSLIAYLVPQPGSRVEFSELRDLLAQRLPAHMIPSAFVWMESLPLTENGKLDHRALPAPAADARPAQGHVPPENSVHAQLIEIWEEVLKRRPIGIRDDFFELGGHSLLVARMLAMTAERLGVQLPFGVIFTEPTIERMASAIRDRHRRQEADQSRVLLNGSGTKAPFFFLHGDFSGGGFFCRSLARYADADRPFYVMHPAGLHGDPVPTTIEEMAVDKLRELRKIQPEGPYLLGGYCNGALVAYEMARRIEAEGGKVPVVIMLFAVGTNVRWRSLRRMAGLVSALRFEGTAARQRRFLRWRETAEFLRGVRRHYARALADLIKQPLAEQARRVFRKMRRVLGRLLGKRPVPDKPPEKNPDAQVHQTESDRTKTDAYMKAVCGYVPGRFGGRVVLIWPQDEKKGPPEGPDFGWKSVCKDIRLVLVPGEHDSCIERDPNLRIIGEQMGRALAESEAHARD